MTLDMGLFFGLCLFVAFYIGRKYEAELAKKYISVVLHAMNDDMDGEVEKWFDTKKLEIMQRRART